jgi:hypothetical protein
MISNSVFTRRRLRYDIERKEITTPTMKSDLLDSRAKLGRNIAKLRGLQRVYTPLVFAALASTEGGDNEVDIEHIPLMLPSDLPEPFRESETMKPWIAMEVDFREAQLDSSLEALCSSYEVVSIQTVRCRFVTKRGRLGPGIHWEGTMC